MHGSRIFRQGGPGSTDRNKPLTTHFIFSYTEFLRKTKILKGSSWGPTFSKGGGVQLFSRGSGGQR